MQILPFPFMQKILLWTMLFFLLACGSTPTDIHDHASEKEIPDTADMAASGDEIHLSREQIKAMAIRFGDFSDILVDDFVEATGRMGLPPNALISVRPRGKGFIRNSGKYVEGSYVKQGTVLAEIESPEFIEMQRQYLDVSAALDFAKKDLARKEKLMQAGAGVEREYQQAQSDVLRYQATKMALAKQLRYLGIQPDEVSPVNLTDKIVLTAPKSGFITSTVLHDGMYVTPEMELLEVADSRHVHLELDVFEKDIAKVRPEQLITYTVPALGTDIYKGEVHVIGKEFSMPAKTVRIHGHMKGTRPPFIKNIFVKAKIHSGNASAKSLPEEAIVRSGDQPIVYVADTTGRDEVSFLPLRIRTGAASDGFVQVELIDPRPAGMPFVVSGTYFVQAQSQAGILEHDH